MNTIEHNGAASVQDVLLPEIVRSPFNRDRSAERNTPAWKEFVESIRQHGIIEPLIARPLPSALDLERPPGTPRLELVIGEGRWLGAAEAGLESAPVIVRQLTDLEAIELQAIENAQRKDLNPLQEAAKYQQLLEHYEKSGGLDKAQAMAALCEKMARSKSAVYETLRLLELEPKVQEAINRGTLPVSHAGLIAKLPPEFQERTAYAIAPGKALSHDEEYALEEEIGFPEQRDELTGLVPFRDAKEMVDEVQREIKQSAVYEKVAAAHRAKGGTALTLAEDKTTKTIEPADYLQEYGGYVRELTKGVKELPAMIMAPSRHDAGKAAMVYRRDELLAALKKAGVKVRGMNSSGGSRTDYAAMERKRKERERREKLVRARVHEPIRAAANKRTAKIAWPLVLPALGGWGSSKRVCDARGWKCTFNNARDVLVTQAAKLPENQMAGLVTEILLAVFEHQPKERAELGKFYGVDVEAIEKEVKAEFAPAAKKSAQKAPVQTPGKKTRAKPSAATKAKIAAALRKTKGGAQ